jgi:hypothetical protein
MHGFQSKLLLPSKNQTCRRGAVRSFLFFVMLRLVIVLVALSSISLLAYAGIDTWTQEGPLSALSGGWEGTWQGVPCVWFKYWDLTLGNAITRISLEDLSYQSFPLPFERADLVTIWQHPRRDSICFMKQLEWYSDTLFRSTDGGNSWQAKVWLNYNSTSCLYWDALRDSIGFFITGSGTWKTTDYGDHWRPFTMPIPNSQVNVNWGNAWNYENLIYFASWANQEFKLYRLDMSTDTLRMVHNFGHSSIMNLRVDRSQHDRIFIETESWTGSHDFLLESLDGGFTVDSLWSLPDSVNGLGGFDQQKRIAQDRINPQRWSSITGGGDDMLYESTDGGRTWNFNTYTHFYEGSQLFAGVHREGELLFCADEFLYRAATDSSIVIRALGTTSRYWANIYTALYSRACGLIRTYLPAGLMRSDDRGASWRPYGHGYPLGVGFSVTRRFYSVSPLNDSLMSDNNWGLSTDGGQSWINANTHFANSPLYTNGKGWTWSPGDVRTVIHWEYGRGPDSLRLARTTDLGQTWTYTYGSIQPEIYEMQSLIFYTTNPETLLACGMAYISDLGGFWFSADSGRSWLSVPGFEHASAQKLWPNYGVNQIYALTSLYGLARNDFQSISQWTPVQTGLDYTTLCLFDPDTAEIVYASTGAGLYRSTNSGVSWDLFAGRDMHGSSIILTVLPGWPKTIVNGRDSAPGGLYFYTHTRAPDNVVDRNVVPNDFNLSVFPNPTNGEVWISVQGNLRAIGTEPLKVYNILGQQIGHIDIPLNFAGKIRWSPTNSNGSSLPSGLYFIRVVDRLAKIVVLR